VVSGSYEHDSRSDLLTDRLYLNDGKGGLTLDTKLLPTVTTSGGCVTAGDMDNDGDLDLFVGGRLVKGQYPFPAESIILENTDDGFKNVTISACPILSNVGMISDAIWTDYDGDNDMDLIVVGEWTDVLVYENNDGLLTRSTTALDKPLVGWWNCIVASDLDGDGDADYVLGNLGENYKYQASDEQPFEIFGGDFDDNGISDIVVSYHSDDKIRRI